MNFENKKLVIFDFDGTLVDSMETFADIAADVILKVYGTPREIARNQYIKTSGLPFFQQLEELHPGDDKNEEAANMFESEKILGYFDQKIYKDVPETLEHLKKQGIKTAVSSNNFQELVDKYMSGASINLDYILGFRSNDFCKGKTHFRHLIETTGYPSEALLFVGDSLKDAERAITSDIEFIGKTGLFTKEDFKKYDPAVYVIEQLKELLF